VTSHSFRKSVATLNDAGLSARIGADQLGHAHVSMTQDRYMKRGRVHRRVADLLDEAVAGGFAETLNGDFMETDLDSGCKNGL
jgi:integrase